MAQIRIRKASADELYDRASHIGMVEAHAQHTQKLQHTMSKMPRTSGRRAEFAEQVVQHMAASAKHFKAAYGPTTDAKPSATFNMPDNATTPQSKRRYN